MNLKVVWNTIYILSLFSINRSMLSINLFSFVHHLGNDRSEDIYIVGRQVIGLYFYVSYILGLAMLLTTRAFFQFYYNIIVCPCDVLMGARQFVFIKTSVFDLFLSLFSFNFADDSGSFSNIDMYSYLALCICVFCSCCC